MLQVVQNPRNGKLGVFSVPAPLAGPGEVLIQNLRSVISAGTEKMALELGAMSLLGKARARPDQVRQVLQKVKSQGLLTTWQQVREKLNEPMPLGYSSAGVVLACGSGVQNLKPGDLVASNGCHAGAVSVPKHLCAAVPEGVSLDQAALTVIAAIALQGVRLAQLGLGDSVLVIGLGLIGQIAVKLLRLQGARVLGTDLDPEKCKLALQMGAERAEAHLSGEAVYAATRGVGADAVIITAGTKSDGPIALAADAVRAKGRVVAVGAVGLNLPRRPFYFKEAEFVVSCSYGPGRYDPEYENRGHDYPVSYVRWTEQRNMQAILDLMGAGQLDLSPLLTHRFPIANAEAAYELIRTGSEPYLGIVLEYPDDPLASASPIQPWKTAAVCGNLVVGCLGAGGFARSVLLPALRNVPSFKRHLICSGRGLSAVTCKERLGFAATSSDEASLINDPAVNVVFVLTRHDQHGRQVVAALKAGKHVFVEKPLALTTDELVAIEETLATLPDPKPALMVGFNRRFAPATTAVKRHFAAVDAPLTISYRFNAGSIPAEHWVQDEEVGGGRIIGEACHAIDLATCLAGAPVVRVFAESIGGPKAPRISDDQCFIILRHANGAVSTIGYLAGGDKSCPKERIEVFGRGRVAVIDDFRRVEAWSGGRHKVLWRGRQDKGHEAELQAFGDALLRGAESPIDWSQLRATTLASILAVRSLREGTPIDVSCLTLPEALDAA